MLTGAYFLEKERTQDDHIPEIVGLGAVAFAGHLALAVLDDVEDLAVGEVFEGGGVGVVLEGELHVGDDIAFAVAVGSVTHGAVVSVDLFGVGLGFGRGFYGVDEGFGIRRACLVRLGRRVVAARGPRAIARRGRTMTAAYEAPVLSAESYALGEWMGSFIFRGARSSSLGGFCWSF